jgi:hypothetical protein
MKDTLILGIISSLIAAAILFSIKKCFQWFSKSSISGIHLDKRILIFSISISTLVFVFGSILQVIMHWVLEPNNIILEIFKTLRMQFPRFFVIDLFTVSLLPGIITGYCCARGRSLSQRIWFAIISALISLSIFDSVLFFVNPHFLLMKGTMLVEPMLYSISDFYFSLLCNILGGPIAGLIIGSITHFLAKNYFNGQILIKVSHPKDVDGRNKRKKA